MSADNEHVEYSEDGICNCVAFQEKLRKRSDNSKPKNVFVCEIFELADIILKCHDPKETPDTEI